MTALRTQLMADVETLDSVEICVAGPLTEDGGKISAAFTWGGGTPNFDSEGVLDRFRQFNLRLRGSEDQVEQAAEDLLVLWESPALLTVLSVSHNVIDIQPVNEDPPIVFTNSLGTAIADVQFSVRVRRGA